VNGTEVGGWTKNHTGEIKRLLDRLYKEQQKYRASREKSVGRGSGRRKRHKKKRKKVKAGAMCGVTTTLSEKIRRINIIAHNGQSNKRNSKKEKRNWGRGRGKNVRQRIQRVNRGRRKNGHWGSGSLEGGKDECRT